jgi:uncharacterized membrane protein
MQFKNRNVENMSWNTQKQLQDWNGRHVKHSIIAIVGQILKHFFSKMKKRSLLLSFSVIEKLIIILAFVSPFVLGRMIAISTFITWWNQQLFYFKVPVVKIVIFVCRPIFCICNWFLFCNDKICELLHN